MVTKIQQIEEEIERERFKRAEKARRIRRNRSLIERIEWMYLI